MNVIMKLISTKSGCIMKKSTRKKRRTVRKSDAKGKTTGSEIMHTESYHLPTKSYTLNKVCNIEGRDVTGL